MPLTLGTLALLATAQARPPAPTTFCETYPEAPACTGAPAACSTCHTVAPALNVYGTQIRAALPASADDEAGFVLALPEVLLAVGPEDADLDAWTNEEEIAAGSDPADADSVPQSADCEDGDPDDGYDVCGYDPAFAFKRVHYDFCGRAPDRAPMAAFREHLAAGADVSGELHEALDRCLQTEAWRGRDGRVWRLGNTRIRPLAAISSNPDEGDGTISLADYLSDYALFVYAQIDGHDARDLLLARYFVDWQPGPPTTYTPYEVGPPLQVLLGSIGNGGSGSAQFVAPDRRAGMITHRWFLMANTMFTAIPRTTAAQAYRSYLGFDIARLEGLVPVEGEPVDYDAKGVAAPDCAVCHSTLDPLTYPFTRYEGIGGGEPRAAGLCDEDGNIDFGNIGAFRLPYSYQDERMEAFVATEGELVAETPEAGMLLGQPVTDLRDWAEAAVAHPAFAENLTEMWWEELLQRPPRADERPTVDHLTGVLRDESFSIDALLHALIDTEAYGAP